ncbi:hypothetical protein [Fluviispira multicolorata]|uniref:Uncharacterized protein n=1 Tax=Fluviispira multicolorata TaxID=2654512 RepID=A0A833JCR3_9BACT|nr:hypothetical protein [Fluviispira multicolorata]KAB8029950.1 hypothetical protein GCL57_10465 [Fluviispira multicolorata]
MDIFAIVSLVFSGIVLLLCAWLVLSKQKISTKVIELNNKLIVLEAREFAVKSPQYSPISEKKLIQTKPQVSEVTSVHSSELLDLRKEVSKLKDDNKKFKEELRLKEKEIKGHSEATMNKLYILTEENSKLIEQMRSMDLELKASHNINKNKVPLQEFENKLIEMNSLKEEFSKNRQKTADLEKNLRQNSLKLSAHLEKLKVTEFELQKWQETARTLDGKSLDPNSFLRWYDRAITGRKMYRLMRQMRELSDSKVTTYQEGVVALSKWVLEQKNLTPPALSENEIQADRLLAEAWNAILKAEANVKSIPESAQSAIN